MSRRKDADDMKNTYVDERVKYLLPKFEELAPYNRTKRKEGVGKLYGWKNLATYTAIALRQRYDETGTQVRQITALKKGLKLAAKKELKDVANYHPVQTIITHFGEALSFLFSAETAKKNEQNDERVLVETSAENRIELDLSPFIKEANATLKQVLEGATKEEVPWRDVSCSLALVTGRRMAEIHASANFKEASDYQVLFKGQLKGKSRKVKDGEKKIPLIDWEFPIPTLIKAPLVIAGLRWLESNDKRLEKGEDPEIVNSRWSKVLSERVRDEWKMFEGMTFHKFRGAYFRACVMNANIDPYDWEDYSKKILGDNDPATIQSYKRFTINPDSLTKI